jgi:4-diphosphocytidyl-2-C-methyl-D-erythritol kinase
MKNDFENSIFAKHPAMEKIKEQLYAMGAVYASMSGSGSSFLGIFNEEQDIEKIKTQFPGMFCWCNKM